MIEAGEEPIQGQMSNDVCVTDHKEEDSGCDSLHMNLKFERKE